MRNEAARYLVAIADHGNFTRAAAELHVSQPALSQQIRQLEEMLGTQLLDRTGRTVRPTDAGQAYIEHARRALREFEAGRRAIRDVENLETGTLRLAFTPTFTTYLVGPLVRRFHGLHPGIAISVTVIAQTEMEAALSEDALDLGIAFGAVQSTDVIAQPLYDEQLCLVVDAGHPAFIHDELAVAELENIDLALLDSSFATRESIDRYADRYRLQLGRVRRGDFARRRPRHHHAPSRRPRGARPEGHPIAPADRRPHGFAAPARRGFSHCGEQSLSPDAGGVGLGSVTPSSRIDRSARASATPCSAAPAHRG
jgi:LysR family cyn operon transcriptional activator